MVGGRLAQPVRAALAFDQGDPRAAIALAERFLRSVPVEDRAARPPALEVLVLAQTARGDHAQAQLAFAELEEIASTVTTAPLQAAVKFAAGILAAAEGKHQTASRHFEDAIDLYRRCGAPFETARAHTELARALFALGQYEHAGVQAHKALEILLRLGAIAEGERASVLIHEADAATQKLSDKVPTLVDLTTRELEVLRLIATGKNNQEIAAELVLSVRTVERHISNIYQKLQLSGPVARTSATAYLLRHELAQRPLS
jgi:ATP/maltotriose-dependent transcriptional regulator MalT